MAALQRPLLHPENKPTGIEPLSVASASSKAAAWSRWLRESY